MKWAVANFEYLFDRLRNGMNVRQSSERNGLPITRIETISNWTIDPERVGYAGLKPGDADEYLLQPGDILFSHINSESHLGKCAIYEGKPSALIHGMNLLCLRPRRGVVSPRYLFYALNGRAFRSQLPAIAKRAVNQASISIGNLRKLRFAVPPPREQGRIVELLEQADGLRRKRVEADTLADSILPTLFHKMFGDPATNPRGWARTSLDQVTEITTGNTPSREDPENFGGAIPWARPGDLETAVPLFQTIENISERGALTARIVPAGSVLVCCIGATLGKVGLAGVEMAINQQINALLPSTKATPEFLYAFCLLNARNFMAAATQATLPILNKSRFGQQPVFLPPLDRQRKFSELAQAVLRLLPAQGEAREKLENLFATMLHRAFTGELTAGWREAHLKELVAEMEQQARMLRVASAELALG